jgi:hypothetical protein
MTKGLTFAIAVAAIDSALLCVSPSAHADGNWWRTPATAAMDSAETLKACAALPAKAEGVDRVGCAITAILAGRTSLARDLFLQVSDADARSCVKQISLPATNPPPTLALMVAYCKARLGGFSESRRLLATLKAPSGDSDMVNIAPQFEAFRIAVLAHDLNGEGEAGKAIALVKHHPQFPSSDILQAELFEIYVEDERRDELIAWWTSLKSAASSDASLRALYEAQIALIRGAPDEASRVLKAVPEAAAQQDGAKALEVARYRVARRSGDKSTTGHDAGRMSDQVIIAPNYQNTSSTSQFSVGLGPFSVNARGVNFNIDSNKLNRPGVALPIGFFY